MAVTRVWERYEDRGAAVDEKAVRTLSRGWSVTTNNDLTAEPAVIAGVIAFDATAALFQPHPFWAFALCRKIEAKPEKSARTWRVRAEYSSAPFAAGGDGSGSGPLASTDPSKQSQDTPADQRPPVIAVSRKEVTVPLEKDVTTLGPVLNTAGDKFDPAPEVFRSRELLTFTFFRAVAALDWTARSDFRDKLNSDAVTFLGKTYNARTLRVVDYGCELVWEAGPTGQSTYFRLTVQLEENPDTWKVKLLNTGRRKLVTVSGLTVPVVITDGQGQPVAAPVPLDASGVPLPPTGPFLYQTFDGYEEVAFNGTGGTPFGAGGLLA